jgi:hypothetical protein
MSVDSIVGGLPEQPEEITVVCEGEDKLKVFEYANGLFGIASAIDEYIYNERFHTHEEAEEWIAAGGQATPLTQCYGDFPGEQGWPVFHDGKFAYWADDQPSWVEGSKAIN